MRVSVVVITHDEAPRLRLTLDSLVLQHVAPPLDSVEIVVVDDGSSDETARVIEEARSQAELVVVRHDQAKGRSAARNAGARHATGDVLLMLDGDVLVGPNAASEHASAHARFGKAMGRGATYHLRGTRFFADPETGTPMPGAEAHVARMSEHQMRASLVTRDEVRARFADIAARSEPGIYAGSGPKLLYELEMRALHAIPDASILWMAASGHNFSMPREEFLSAGGYEERLTINEHRELALRLQKNGLRVTPVDAARSIHMLHRVGWRDPAGEPDWERTFYERHPTLATKLMSVFWLSLAGDKGVPEEARILSLEQLEEIVQRGTRHDYDALRRAHAKLGALD
ncbi:MAG: glycosyltransferase family 2 protein [Polyangiaceae bacterium]